MSILFGHKSPAQATSVDKVNGIRVTQPIQGQPIPIAWGQQRIPMGLLDYTDFTQATITQKQQSSGGKGFGGSGSTASTSYVYSATVLGALAYGPVAGIVNVYDTKGMFQQASVSENFTVPGGGGSYQVANHSRFANDLGVGIQTPYSQVVNDFGSPGSTTLSGTYNVGTTNYTLNPATGTYTFGSGLGGQTLTITYTYNLLTITEQEISNVPSTPFQIAVENNSQFNSNVSVAYYPSNNLLTQVNSSPAAGQYTVSAGTYTFNSADSGSAVLITYTINDNTASAQGAPSALNFTLFEGTTGQAAWSYMASAHPDRATGYTQIAYIAAQGMQLGSSGELPNYTFEILGPNSFGNGIPDCNPAACINSIILDPVVGVGSSGSVQFPPTGLGSMAQASSFWVANGFFISPVIQNQRTAADIIKDWIEAGMTAAYVSEGQIKFIPYGDTSAAGNGQIFVPSTQPIVDLDDDDFLPQGKGTDPVKIASVSLEDAYNRVQVQYSNRLNNYNPEIVIEQNDTFIQRYGIRLEPPVNWDFICTLPVATVAANLRLKRSMYVQATYQFSIGRKYSYLEPMDLVTITLRDSNGNALPGFNKLPVRIQKIVDDPQKGLAITAEEFPWGTAAPTLYGKQTNLPFYPSTGQADPGVVNAPIIFEAPPAMSRTGNHEIWMAVSGQNENFGGAQVWLSFDNSEYEQIGTIDTPARMGTLAANVASGSDPDTTNYFPVDLTPSQGTLAGGTQNDADTFRTLCYADGEFISYRDANLTSSANYQVGRNAGGTVYVRRGLFGSRIASHSSGASFARLDSAIFSFTYDPSQIGKTIYIKFLAFNKDKNRLQQLSQVSPYTFVLAGQFNQNEMVGKNLLANPGFESNQALTALNARIYAMGTRFSDNWTLGYVFHSTPNIGGYYTNGTGYGISPRSGSRMAGLFADGANLANGNEQIVDIVSDPFPCAPGETYSFGGYWYLSPLSVPQNLTLRIFLVPYFFDSAGKYLSDGVDSGYTLTGSVGPNAAISAIPQNSWQKISNYLTVPPTIGGKVPAFIRMAIIMDMANATGSTYSFGGSILELAFDDMWLFPQWTPTGDEIAKQGSMSVTYAGTFSYTSTTSSITWNWNLNALRTDLNMTVNTYSGSQACTGLSAGQSYNHYPFIDEINQVFNMVSTGGIGTPAWAHNGTSLSWVQEQSRSDHYQLSTVPVVGSTVNSGTGGGSGGGVGGPCLRSDAVVREKRKGVIPASQLKEGDWVHCPVAEDTPDGWAEVIFAKEYEGREWIHTHFNNGDWLATSSGHPFTLDDGTTKRAMQLNFEDIVPCTTGIAFIVSHSFELYEGKKTTVTINSKAHTFYAGMNAPSILQHNFITQS